MATFGMFGEVPVVSDAKALEMPNADGNAHLVGDRFYACPPGNRWRRLCVWARCPDCGAERAAQVTRYKDGPTRRCHACVARLKFRATHP